MPFDDLSHRLSAVLDDPRFRAIVNGLRRKIRIGVPGTDPRAYVIAALANGGAVVAAAEAGHWPLVRTIVCRAVISALRKDSPLVRLPASAPLPPADFEAPSPPEFLPSGTLPDGFSPKYTPTDKTTLLSLDCNGVHATDSRVRFMEVLVLIGKFHVVRPDDAAMIFALYVVERSQNEVQHALKLSNGAFRARLHRARRRFAEFLRDSGYDP